jgi:hypothetical protein
MVCFYPVKSKNVFKKAPLCFIKMFFASAALSGEQSASAKTDCQIFLDVSHPREGPAPKVFLDAPLAKQQVDTGAQDERPFLAGFENPQVKIVFSLG